MKTTEGGHGTDFPWAPSIMASLAAAVVFSVAAVALRNVSTAPRTFVLLVTGAVCGAVIVRLPLTRSGRALAVSVFLIVAGLASPSVLRPSPADPQVASQAESSTRTSPSSTTTTETTTTSVTAPPDTLPKVRYLEDMKPAESFTMYLSSGPAKVNGQTYERSVIFPTMYSSDFGDSESFGYDLSRAYVTFRAAAGLRDDSTGDSRAKFEVLGDDRQLFSQRLSLGETAALELDVTGVLRLQLIVTRETGDRFTPAWGDARVQAPS